MILPRSTTTYTVLVASPDLHSSSILEQPAVQLEGKVGSWPVPGCTLWPLWPFAVHLALPGQVVCSGLLWPHHCCPWPPDTDIELSGTFSANCVYSISGWDPESPGHTHRVERGMLSYFINCYLPRYSNGHSPWFTQSFKWSFKKDKIATRW